MYLLEITKQLRADDLHVEIDNLTDAMIFVAQNGFNDDGYRIIMFDPGAGGELRAGSKAQLRTAAFQTEYKTLAEARAQAATIDPSDGYDILDLEQPVGSANTIIVENRPPLWLAAYEGDMAAGYVASRVNGWGRTDLDRL